MAHRRIPAWLESLYVQKFFAPCSSHGTAKKNEKNICCLDCCESICPHCVFCHRSHRLLQIRRYVYHEVVRLEDLQMLVDCSNIQAYTINAAKVVFIKKRPQNRQFRGTGNYCSSCARSLQEPFVHCSLGCKVEFVLKHYMDISPFLKVCNTLRLGSDFFIPQDAVEDETTNVTPNSTVMDYSDGPSSWSSGSSGSENTTSFTCNVIVKKKRSGMYFTREDKTTSNSLMRRRKRVPRRSPLC